MSKPSDDNPFLDAPPPTDPAPYGLRLGNGQTLNVAEEGEGPCVLMLHGIPGSLRDFRYLGPALAARGMRAVRLDFPGFGETPFAAFPALDNRNRAALFLHIADALGVDQFAVVGHSFGGAACFLAAAMFEQRVLALGLVSSIGVVRHKGFSPIPPPVLRLAARALERPIIQEAMLDKVNALYARMGFKGPFSVEDVTLHARLIARVDFKDHRQALRAVRCPVLVASAEDDPLVDAKSQHLLVDAFADSTYVRHLHFSQGGHYLQKFAAHPLAAHLQDIITRAQQTHFADSPAG